MKNKEKETTKGDFRQGSKVWGTAEFKECYWSKASNWSQARPLDEDPRPKSGKLRLNLHGAPGISDSRVELLCPVTSLSALVNVKSWSETNYHIMKILITTSYVIF
jgi:hypothetical protein